VVALVAIDPSQLLSFDTSDMRTFSQGRSDIWAGLWAGMTNFTFSEWMLGQGFFADSRLMADNSVAGQDIHNAHNELLHLLATQGIAGLVVYCGLWVWMYRMCRPRVMPAWARGTVLTAVIVYLFQGVTTVMSPFATKTWPLVMVFLAVRCLDQGDKGTGRWDTT
jgi:O-antigen ligase